jgi:hypothetical protein
MTKPSELFLEIIADLPAKPIEALAVVADRARRRIISPTTKLGSGDDYIAIVTFMDRFSERFGLGIQFPLLQPDASNYMRLEAYVREIRSLGINAVEKGVSDEIDDVISAYEGSAPDSFGLAHLNAEEKRKILEHIERARQIIEGSKISDRKKNALYERLASLAKEVNLHGTRTDRFFAFAGDLGFVLGDMAEKAKPLFDEIKDMMKILTRARARHEGVSLPSGDEVLKLMPPDDTVSD